MTPNGTKLAMLIVSDSGLPRTLGNLAARAGWRLLAVGDADGAITALGTRDGMMLDAILIETDIGLDALAELHQRRPALPIIAHADSFVDAAAALRAGAQDYVSSPFSAERGMAALEQAFNNRMHRLELRPLSEKLEAPLGFGDIVGADPRFRTALAIAAKGARTRAPALIEGESGVGKDMLARAIHSASPRDRRAFIRFDCASVAPALLVAMLLGHEKNAFTGAFERHVGQITLADAGTLFLDNVDLLPFEAQIAVLQVIEHQRVQVLGRVQPETVDVRIIAGTSVGLSSLVKSERFREDLFYKLNAVSVALPPLRERRGDIEPLVRHLLGRIIALPGMRGMGITDAAMELLTTYAWPGNVRQLGSVLLRALLACDGDALTVTEFPTIAAQTREILPAGANSYALSGSVNLFTPDGQMRPLADIEADIIRLAIGHYRGRMAEVSRRLGIGRSTLYRKLEELGLADVA